MLENPKIDEMMIMLPSSLRVCGHFLSLEQNTGALQYCTRVGSSRVSKLKASLKLKIGAKTVSFTSPFYRRSPFYRTGRLLLRTR